VQQGLWCPTKKLATVIEGFTDAISGFSVSYYDGCMTNGRLINYALPVILPDLSTTGKNGLNSFSIGYQDTARQASCRFASITRSIELLESVACTWLPMAVVTVARSSLISIVYSSTSRMI